MAEAHIAGFFFLLTDGGILLDDAESPNFAALPRTVGYADPGASERETLAGSPDGVVITIQTTCIGETREQAGLELDRVRELVEGKRPSVPGWVCNTIKNLFSNLPRRDDDVDPAVFYAVATWRFTAVPA
jgi:hypothetical protein